MTTWAWFWDRNIRKKTAHLAKRRQRPMLVEHAGGRHIRKPTAESRQQNHTEHEQDA